MDQQVEKTHILCSKQEMYQKFKRDNPDFKKEIHYISQVDTDKFQVLKPCLSQSVYMH